MFHHQKPIIKPIKPQVRLVMVSIMFLLDLLFSDAASLFQLNCSPVTSTGTPVLSFGLHAVQAFIRTYAQYGQSIKTIVWHASLQWADDLCLTCVSGRPLTRFYDLKETSQPQFSHLDITDALSDSLSHWVINKEVSWQVEQFEQTSGQQTHQLSARPASERSRQVWDSNQQPAEVLQVLIWWMPQQG